MPSLSLDTPIAQRVALPAAMLLPLLLSACGGGNAVLVTESANPAAACAALSTNAQLSNTHLSTSY